MYFCVHQSSCCYRCTKSSRWWGRIPPTCVHLQCQPQLSKLGVGVLNLAIVQWSSFIFHGWNQSHEGWLYSLKTEMWVVCSFTCREPCVDLSVHIVCKSVCGKTLELCVDTSHWYLITRHHKDHHQVCCTWNSTSYHENAVFQLLTVIENTAEFPVLLYPKVVWLDFGMTRLSSSLLLSWSAISWHVLSLWSGWIETVSVLLHISCRGAVVRGWKSHGWLGGCPDH